MAFCKVTLKLPVGEHKLSFSLFNVTHLVMEESVILFRCHIFNNMTFWPQMSNHQGISRNGLFQCRVLFVCTQWRHISMTQHVILRMCSHRHTIWSFKTISPWWCFRCITHYKVGMYCLMMMLVDVGNWCLVQYIHERLYVHHIYNLKLWRILHYKIW